MSEIKHTPGPWTVDGPPQNQIVWSSPQHRVCFLAHSNGTDDARDLATGRLIAASPEMYEALREIAAFDDEGGNQILAATGLYSGFDEPGSVQIARAILSKLEGK